MYKPGAPYRIYCHGCWWSDDWDPLEYGREYDSDQPFFEQFDALLHQAPLPGLSIDKITGQLSPYTNHVGHSKNSYLIYYSDLCEDSAYGFYLVEGKQLFDCSIAWHSEQCYDTMNSWKNYRVHGSRGNVHESVDCYFIKDSKNCSNCFGSANMRNKQYVFFNQQLTKEEYEKKVKEIDLGSYKVYQEMKQKAESVWKNTIPHPYHDDFSVNVTGNYVFKSKNCHECYDSGYCEDCKYIFLIKQPTVKDSYDYIDWGENAERIYESVTVGNGAKDVRFTHESGHAIHDIEYSKAAINGSYQFGCISMRNKQYCILNKQYTKEEYEALRNKIIAKMKADGEYGEFFPMRLSPHAYNDTFANLFFPKTKEGVQSLGLKWNDIENTEHKVTMQTSDIPDHIKDADDSILEEVIQCPACPRGYKIIHQELQFLRQHRLPLPRACPFCRIESKVKRWIWQMTLVQRTCDKCGASFQTNYTKKDAPKIFCKKCYNKEIL